ncbi:CDPK adapter protein 1 [Heracleum sosnowskyi]|uniref:CDPK adapter protein 1 n=1 Tax=Heracleum sosnowskyi TaxID=360622 RepID=A0AAD8I6F0_9APIA|nr:CDPK adapter protein 1 [Heracleum sosnowskyi]
MGTDKGERNGGLVDMRKPGLDLFPVSPYSSGEGLPYAPVDWPCPGDKWSWKVGKRTVSSGEHFWDRFLYLPERLQGKHKGRGFVSKVSVEKYVLETRPGTDVKAFFDSFSWKIPFKTPSEFKEHSWSGSQRATGDCKAGNKLCSSLIEPGKPQSGAMFCDICCSEPGFCGDCCCILCGKTVDPANASYSFIRCEATVEKSVNCGHLAHLDCGLKSNMAGTVGGSVCLDVEYYCLRCDTRTDLLPHVKKFLKICESIESIDDINKILKLGVSVLHGSRRSEANRLLYIFELAMGKQQFGSGIKSGTALENVRNADNISAVTQGMTCNINENHALKVDEEYVDMGLGSPKKVSEIFDPVVESLKFDHHVDRTLQAFKKTQEWEYNITKDKLHKQKSCIQNLYRQLHKEKIEIARHMPYFADPDDLIQLTGSRVDQINKELRKLEDMKAVSKGFAETPKEILKEHFGFEM